MAISNKEIINNQLKRINEKMRTTFVAHKSNGMWCLCIEYNGMEMPPYPLSNSTTMRTSSQMIDYLSGVEDAVDFYTHNGTANGD